MTDPITIMGVPAGMFALMAMASGIQGCTAYGPGINIFIQKKFLT